MSFFSVRISLCGYIQITKQRQREHLVNVTPSMVSTLNIIFYNTHCYQPHSRAVWYFKEFLLQIQSTQVLTSVALIHCSALKESLGGS